MSYSMSCIHLIDFILTMEEFTSINKQTVSILIFIKGNVSILNQYVCPVGKRDTYLNNRDVNIFKQNQMFKKPLETSYLPF